MQSLRSLLGRSVISIQTQKNLGKIKRGVVDPDTGRLVAFELKTALTRNWLALVDVREYGEDEILINSEGKLLILDDLPRVKKLLQSSLKVVQAKVFTESGRFLGRVSDVVFDEHSGEIIKYYIAQPFLLNPLRAYLILDRKQILRVERKGLIVKDPEKKAPVQALA